MSKVNDLIARFDFHAMPFTCELRVEEYFFHDLYNEQLQYLADTVNKRMAAALIAPAGTGKTALLRALVARLPETRYRIHYVKVADLSKRDLCREVAAVTGIETTGNYPTLVRRLQDRFASSLDIDGLRPVLIIDEAHDIRPDVLGVLRILTNFEMDSRLVVSIILSGQAPLAQMLQKATLEDIANRLTHYATLRLLSRKEISLYVQHRCRIAGASSCPFDNSAVEALYEIGRGNLRATNHLALKALEVAHKEESDIVDTNHITHAKSMLCA